jgi:dihydrofolate synthase/folylpolyglutamate synthase
VLFCALRDKEWQDMLSALAPMVDVFVLTNAPTAPDSRAWDLRTAGEFAAAAGMRAVAEPDFDAALRLVSETDGSVVITGSFHTVGDAMARLQVSPFVL